MEKLNNNTLALQALLTKVNNLPEGGSSGGGGSGGGTCSITMELPSNVCVFGWGTYTRLLNGTTNMGEITMPSATTGLTHVMPANVTNVFDDIPVGSVFVFYRNDGIKGASVSGNIEFTLLNHTLASMYPNSSKYLFAACRCNGDGTITIQV